MAQVYHSLRKDSRMTASCTITPITEFGGERRTYEGVAQPFAAHSHDYYVIGTIRKGKRTLNLNGSNLVIEQNDMIIFNPGDAHSCSQVCDNSLSYDSLTLSKEFFEGATLRFPNVSDNIARISFERALTCLDEKRIDEAADELAKIGSLLEVSPTRFREVSTHEGLASKLFASFKRHLANPIKVCEFAKSEGISPYSLIRAYKRKFSITPTQHLLSLRFEAARELLTKGASVADTAIELGFADQSHLTRVFKQRLGITPAAYRSMMLR